MHSNTAILFFTLSAKAERCSKHFIGQGDDPRNTRIAATLIQHTDQQINKAGLPCFVFDEKHQQGNNFAERLTNAFKEIFDKGFQNVIALGNDTPGLKATHIKYAARELATRRSDIVLGPATDGGTWLMGYSRLAFEKERFQKLPWNSSELLENILYQASEKFSITLLEELADIDGADSLQQFIRTFYGDRSLLTLALFIRTLLAIKIYSFCKITWFYFAKRVFKTASLRAPPL